MVYHLVVPVVAPLFSPLELMEADEENVGLLAKVAENNRMMREMLGDGKTPQQESEHHRKEEEDYLDDEEEEEEASAGVAAAVEAEGEDVQTLEAKLREETDAVAQLRKSLAQFEMQPRSDVAAMRQKRDSVRLQVQELQRRLALVSQQRRASSKKLEKKLQRDNTLALLSELTPASNALMSAEALRQEIKRLKLENAELEKALPQQEETRLYLEKIDNERRDVQRKMRALQTESRQLDRSNEEKAQELRDLQVLIEPSPAHKRNEEEVARLKAEVHRLNQTRVAAEREVNVKSRRLHGVRLVLEPFFKTMGRKPPQPLLEDDSDEIVERLASYVINSGIRVRASVCVRARACLRQRRVSSRQEGPRWHVCSDRTSLLSHPSCHIPLGTATHALPRMAVPDDGGL